MIRFFVPLLLLGSTALAGDYNSPELWEEKGKAVWTFDDGIIRGSQDGDPKRSGLLITNAEFKDFEMTFSFKIDEHGKYNSGVYFRFDPEMNGPRLQLNLGRGVADEPVGLYLDEWLDKGDEKDKFRKPQEWNEVRLLVKNSRVQVWLNRMQIVDYEDSARLSGYQNAGRIALQTYGAEGHDGWVEFREVSIRELP